MTVLNTSIQDVVRRKQERKDDFQKRGIALVHFLAVWIDAVRNHGRMFLRDEPGNLAWHNALDIWYLRDINHPEAKYAKIGDRQGLWFKWDNKGTGRGDDWGVSVFFYDLRPSKVSQDDIVYGPPDLVDSETISQVAISEKNFTYDPIPWTPSFADRRETEDTDSKQLGTTISLGLRQLISYGGDAYAFKGETEVTTSIQQSINLGEQRRKLFRSDIDSVVDIKVPPFQQLHRTRTVKEGTYKQRITTKAPIDFGIVIESARDFRLDFSSREDAILAMTGSVADNGHNWADLFRQNSIREMFNVGDDFDELNKFLAPMYGVIDTEIEIKGALDYEYTTQAYDLPIPEDGKQAAE